MTTQDNKVINLNNYREDIELELIDHIGSNTFEMLRSETSQAGIRILTVINANFDFLIDVLQSTGGNTNTLAVIERLEAFIQPETKGSTKP